MSKNRPTYDVFLSYSAQDAMFAAEITRTLQSSDLVVFDKKAIPPGNRIEDATWEAMAEAQALVAVFSEGEPSASTILELGAANGWNKPVYLVVSNPASMRLPSFLRGLPVYPPTRIEELARAIKDSSLALSDSETAILIEEYQRIGEPVDQLVIQPAMLAKLNKHFKKRAKRQVAPEELVRSLLRLRKRGALRAAIKKNRVKVAK